MSMDAPTMDVLRKQAIAMAMLWLTARDYDHEGGRAWFHVRARDLGLRDDVLPGKRIRVTIEAELDTDGVGVPAPWEAKVHCSKGERTLRAGLRWRDGLHGSTWEVVEPEGARIYSPSGLGGTPTFWCRPVGILPAGAEHLLDGHREDGCVSFCGDSIAAGLIEPCGVKGKTHG